MQVRGSTFPSGVQEVLDVFQVRPVSSLVILHLLWDRGAATEGTPFLTTATDGAYLVSLQLLGQKNIAALQPWCCLHRLGSSGGTQQKVPQEATTVRRYSQAQPWGAAPWRTRETGEELSHRQTRREAHSQSCPRSCLRAGQQVHPWWFISSKLTLRPTMSPPWGSCRCRLLPFVVRLIPPQNTEGRERRVGLGEAGSAVLCWSAARQEDCTKPDRQNKIWASVNAQESAPRGRGKKRPKMICNSLIMLETACTQLAGEKGAWRKLRKEQPLGQPDIC